MGGGTSGNVETRKTSARKYVKAFFFAQCGGTPSDYYVVIYNSGRNVDTKSVLK